MALLDNAKKAAVPAEVQSNETPVEAGKKKSNSEYQKRQREKALASAQTVRKFVEANCKDIPQDVVDALDFLTRVKKTGANNGNFGVPVFEKLFGAEPKEGMIVNAYDMLKKTGKGFGDMTKLIKKWAEKGTVVEFNEEKLEYKLVKLSK